MKDPRLTELADLLVNYSNEIKPKERVLILSYGVDGLPLAKEIYKECVRIGAYPTYEIREAEFSRIFFEHANDDQLDYQSEVAKFDAERTDAMFQIICDRNTREMAHIDQQKIIRKRKATKEISDILHDKKWVLFEYPTEMGAYNAGMNTEAWENFVFDSCLTDWKTVSKEQDALKDMLEKTKTVRLTANNGTDFSIGVTAQPWIKCCGKRNMPDGEIFCGPIRDSAQGTIRFNTPTSYMNRDFQWIELTFENGKVVDFDSDKKADLEEILNTDEGSKYLGEFAFGTNKNIEQPVKSILFDEKIGGSNHMALGKCYDESPNENESAIHWDLILRHAEVDGKVYLDDQLIQEAGIWVHPALVGFNR